MMHQFDDDTIRALADGSAEIFWKLERSHAVIRALAAEIHQYRTNDVGRTLQKILKAVQGSPRRSQATLLPPPEPGDDDRFQEDRSPRRPTPAPGSAAPRPGPLPVLPTSH